MRIDKTSHTPIYIQLKDILVEMISDNYSDGDLLPSEPELEKMFGVSRVTVRQAVNILVEEGMVEKQQGRGTFVQKHKATHKLMVITSWTEEMTKKGFTPSTVDMTITRISASRKIKNMLNMLDEESVVRIRRVRYADNEPICIMTNYLNESYVPNLVEEGLLGESLYSTLKDRYGLRFVKAEVTVGAREATSSEAELLDISEWSPVLLVTTVTYVDEETPAEVVSIVSRADKYQFENILYVD